MENKQDKGFTLVELLIVIVILGILATVTVFAVRGITDNAQTNSCQVEKRTIETAIEAFYADNQQAVTNSENNVPAGTGFAQLNPEYLKEDPASLQADWSFTGGDRTTEAVVTGLATGDCAGV